MTAPAPSAIDAVHLAQSLRPAVLRVSRVLRQQASTVGLSALDALLLGQIRNRPGIGVSQLADAERMTRPTMSVHVKRLEAAGWVARASDLEDARRFGLSITPAGVVALEAVRRERNDWLAARLAALPPEARQALADAVEPLLQLVEIQP
jgi:DNA-binding MarR family transcriptional regulator